MCGIDDAEADEQLLAAGGPILQAAVGLAGEMDTLSVASEKLNAVPPEPITPLPPRKWLCCTKMCA